jgi:hypothetical protein
MAGEKTYRGKCELWIVCPHCGTDLCLGGGVCDDGRARACQEANEEIERQPVSKPACFGQYGHGCQGACAVAADCESASG